MILSQIEDRLRVGLWRQHRAEVLLRAEAVRRPRQVDRVPQGVVRLLKRLSHSIPGLLNGSDELLVFWNSLDLLELIGRLPRCFHLLLLEQGYRHFV